MFQRLMSNKPDDESVAPSALAPVRKSEIDVLKGTRSAVEAEIEVLAGQFDKASEALRDLRKKAKPRGWHEANYGASLPRIYSETAIGRALDEAVDRADQLRAKLDDKAAELERLTKQIHAIEREVPGRLRREALEAAMPLAFELIDALCLAAGHEAEFVRLGGHVERSIPWEFALAGGDGIELETVMSRWLKALQREGITVPGDIFDNSRHLPAPSSFHARVQTDAGYAAHHSLCGVKTGWRNGFLDRARMAS